MKQACRGTRQGSAGPLSRTTLSSKGLSQLRKERMEANETEEMELLIYLSLKGLTREQVIDRLEFGVYRSL